MTLSLHDELLTITGERHRDETHPGKASLRTERCFGRFECTINLPTQVDGTRVIASYENGILPSPCPKPKRLRRILEVDSTIDAARISAGIDQGLLTLRLPKAETAKPRRIEINGLN